MPKYSSEELAKKPWFTIRHYNRRKLLFMPDKYAVRHEVLEGPNPGTWTDYYYQYRVGEDLIWRKITHMFGPIWMEFGYPLYDDSWSQWMNKNLVHVGSIRESFFDNEDDETHWWKKL